MEREYLRKDVIKYAREWAYKRNPIYYNYDNLGGDCTNFISQCIFAGSKIMNYKPTFGWYYINANNKSPSWTGVEYLYNYLTRKSGTGPIGKLSTKEEVIEGDIIQLSFGNNKFEHSLVITEKKEKNIYVAAHTFDTFNKSLELYGYDSIRFIHIEKVII